MPIINVKLTPPGVTKEEKARIIAGMTQVLVEVLNKKPELTFVIIDEVETEDWGFGGKSVADQMDLR